MAAEAVVAQRAGGHRSAESTPCCCCAGEQQGRIVERHSAAAVDAAAVDAAAVVAAAVAFEDSHCWDIRCAPAASAYVVVASYPAAHRQAAEAGTATRIAAETHTGGRIDRPVAVEQEGQRQPGTAAGIAAPSVRSRGGAEVAQKTKRH